MTSDPTISTEYLPERVVTEQDTPERQAPRRARSTQEANNSKLTWIQRTARKYAGNYYSKPELTTLLKQAYKNNVLGLDALTISEGALHLADMQVRDVMIPRAQTVKLKLTDSPRKIIEQVIESSHSRYPIIGDNPDDIEGILLAKDLLKLALNNNLEQSDMRTLLRPAILIPESKSLDVMLKEFKQTHNHMAIVVNEYGGMAGIITIEDVLEQVVGEIEDEHDIDEDSAHIRKLVKNQEWNVKGLTLIEDFNSNFKTNFSDEQFDTIGGFISNAFGKLPKPQESITLGALQFTVLNSNSRRITLLRVRK